MKTRITIFIAASFLTCPMVGMDTTSDENVETALAKNSITTALYITDQTVRLNVIRRLLEAKANPNALESDEDGALFTPLSRIIKEPCIVESAYPLCKMLLAHGAHVNAPSIRIHQTPLLMLCDHWQNKIFKSDSFDDVSQIVKDCQLLALTQLLLDAGADPTIEDADGYNPIEALSPDSELWHDCNKQGCSVDHSECIRTVNQSMLDVIQKHQKKVFKIIRSTLESYHNKDRWKDPAFIIAGYLVASTPEAPLRKRSI